MKKGLVFFWVYVWTFGFIAGTSVGLLMPVHKVGAILLSIFFSILAVLLLPIKNSRSRQASDVVESDKGGADDEGAKKLSHDNVVGDDCSPPSERAPPHYSHRWDRWVIREPSPEMVDALVKSIKFVSEHPWAKWPLMIAYTVFIWPILRRRER